jgi:hypothetical protein
MHKNATKCNKTQSKWCINKHGASKIIDTFGTYHDVTTKVVAVVLVLGLVASGRSFQAHSLHLLERMAVLGGVVHRVARTVVHDAWFVQHSLRIKLWLVWVFAPVVPVSTAIASSIAAESFGITRAGLNGVGDEVEGAIALPSVAGVAVAQILAMMVLSRGPPTGWIASRG